MKAYDTSYLFNAKKLRKNLIFDKKNVFDATNFMSILNISENTKLISTNLVLNESL